jgi:hypothetical protein
MNSSVFLVLRGVTWLETDVSGLPIGTIFKGQVFWIWGRQVVPKRRYQTTLRRVMTKKSEKFSSISAEAWGNAKFFTVLYMNDFPDDGRIMVETCGEKRCKQVMDGLVQSCSL